LRYGQDPEEPQLSIESTTVDGRVVLEARGEIDVATAPALEAALKSATTPPVESIIIDLGGVRFLDSTALQALIRGRNRALALGASYVVVNLQPIPHRVLEVTGLLKLLTSDGDS
jgi:anti-anti-sigma factor